MPIVRGVWGTPQMPPGYPQDRESLEALVRRCFAAAAAPRLGETVWLGGWLEEGFEDGFNISICQILVGLSGPKTCSVKNHKTWSQIRNPQRRFIQIPMCWGVWGKPGMPPGYPPGSGVLDALVCGYFAAAAVWLGGWLEEGFKKGRCISICKILVDFQDP